MSSRTSRLTAAPPELNILPPWALTVIAIMSTQTGAAIAKSLFETIGFGGVVFLRTLVAAVVFLVFMRPRLHGYTPRTYLFFAVYGMAITLNMLTFYAAIDRIPMGIAVAISFAGPLALSVMGSRRGSDLAWIGVAVVGILLLSPITDVTLDPVGVMLAFGCAIAWAAYVMLTKRAGNLLPGNTTLALSMGAAALFAAPFGAAQSLHVLGSIEMIALALVVTLMSSVLPFWLEFLALKQLSPRVFGLLMSLEPAVATVVGWILLHETLGIEKIAGIALVTVAAAATTRQTTS
ncbi:MAG: EamA family transporter [Anaerolineae bacterium]|nr:EamA family transporter [Anaerolineae bacterium]